MSDREKARDLGNKSAELARAIADVLNDTLDALERCERRAEAAERARDEALLAKSRMIEPVWREALEERE